MSEGQILFEKDPCTHIAVLTIDNPKQKNVFDLELRNAMTDVMEDVADDDDMKVLLLRGAGGVFCSGADMGKAYSWYDKEGETRRPSQRRRLTVDRSRQHMYHLWCGYPKATVVQLDGLALGGGLELALGADLVVAGRNPRIGMPAAPLLGSGARQPASLLSPHGSRAHEAVTPDRRHDAVFGGPGSLDRGRRRR